MDDGILASGFTQAQRLLRIATPLGADALLMERFSGWEGVNGLFAFQAVVRAKRDDVAASDLIGHGVDVDLALAGGGRRVWHALVTALAEEPRLTRGLRGYVLTLRPELWLLSQRSDCRIWLGRTALEVARTLLAEHGLRAPDVRGVLREPPAQAYSVQWNETDLAYLLRRLEEDGLHYWFRHEGEAGQEADQGTGQGTGGGTGGVSGSHQLVIADSAAGWDAGADGASGLERFAAGSTDRHHISAWQRTFAFVPGSRAGRDWNFETPALVPGAEAPGRVALPRNGAYSLYEYPARARDGAASERAMGLRAGAVEADHEVITGASTLRTLAPGAKVTPYDLAQPDARFETAVITGLTHEAVDTTYEAGSGEPSYTNRFTAQPARLPATPHRTTPRPRIEGAQIALIAGPPGEEIHTDQHGRVKLWFPWDRRARRDGSDTVWVRVAQAWAGGTWGAQVIPRIGMEAVVTFEGGDPDRPLVTGLVPNPVKKVPYPLPANKTKSVFRTNTHQSKTPWRFNELTFEDEAGREEIYLHAQKDMSTHVENNHAMRIDNNKAESVGNNISMTTGNVFTHTVGGDMNLSVGATEFTTGALSGFNFRDSVVDFLTAGLSSPLTGYRGIGNFSLSVANCKTETVSVSSSEIVGVAKATSVAGAYEINVGGDKSTSVAGCVWNEIGVSYSTLVGERFEVVCGDSRLMMTSDGKIEIEGKEIILKGTDLVTINGKLIKLN